MQILEDTPNLSKFYLLNLNKVWSHDFGQFLFVFLPNFELNVVDFGSRSGVTDIAVVSGFAIVFNLPARCCIRLIEKSILDVALSW